MAVGIKEMWDATIRFYDELVEAGEDFGQMLSLVKTMSVSDFAETVHPSTSLCFLNLSCGANYSDRQKLPMVSIDHRGVGNFAVRFYRCPTTTHDLLKYQCHSLREVWSLLQALFLRLEISSNEAIKSDEP